MNTMILQSQGRLPTPMGRQRGVVLIVSLILLMILTLIGVTAMQTSTLEERMTGNALDRALAFQAAEAALRAGENRLYEDTTALREAEQGYLGQPDYNRDDLPLEPWEWGLDRVESEWAMFDDETLMSAMDVARPPYYAVELLDPNAITSNRVSTPDTPEPEGVVYRVTAMGWGATEDTQVVLQSFYLLE